MLAVASLDITNPLPLDATWTDHVNAHGCPEASGWWVTLRWYADSEHLRPEVVGRYPSWEQAVAAMEDSLLIDGFAGDTDRDDWLDDVYVAPDPALIARMWADYGHRVTLIDAGDRATSALPPLNPPVTAGSGLHQAGALHAPSLDEGEAAAVGISVGTDRFPAGSTM